MSDAGRFFLDHVALSWFIPDPLPDALIFGQLPQHTHTGCICLGDSPL